MEVHSKNILILTIKTLTEMWGFFYIFIYFYTYISIGMF